MVFIGIDLPQDIFRQGWTKAWSEAVAWGNTGVCCICNVFAFAAAQVDTIAPR